MSTFLSPSTFSKVEELFKAKNWPIETGLSSFPSLFDSFCTRLSLFTSDEQDFLLELSLHFIVVGTNEYYEKFLDSLLDMFIGEELLISKSEKIVVFPLLSKDNINSSTKSAGFLHYMFQTEENRWLSTKFNDIANYTDLEKHFEVDKSILVLIDDFIGTGETAISVCNEILELNFKGAGKIPENRIKIVSIAGMQAGINKLDSEYGIKVYSRIIQNKGISDNYNAQQLENYISLMVGIEEKLKIKDHFKFGYGKSESLLSLRNKTPNNTFPVYWHETKIHIAPYPRKKNFKA